MAIPARRIPESLLAEAQGVVIVPNVIKVGFIAGARRGHGVVLVRDNDGEWSLPQFVTLTGGSVGWQAGIQGTDVILVFTTKKGVEGLLSGKFTIGADAAATAGPVGRNAAAATDATLRSEILSYSRSRGLFLGVAIDGSVLEIDQEAHLGFYGSPSTNLPRFLPPAAAELRQQLVSLTPVQGPPGAAGPVLIPAVGNLDALRRALDANSRRLFTIIDPPWQQYLAMPREVFEAGAHPNPQTLSVVLQRYDLVAKSGNYKQLADRPEFQATYEVLREYAGALSAAVQPALQLGPPPTVK
jgi:SH3 domain-containing YSC84-like protein 1